MSIEQLQELARKVEQFGLDDLSKLAPIGDLGYLNAISYYRGDPLRSELIDNIMKAFYEQYNAHGWTVESKSSKWRNTDNSYYCPELKLYWQIDSGD